MPDAIIVAGPNGAGKSTILPTIRTAGAKIGPYEPNPVPESNVIDPDQLARDEKLGDFGAGRAAIEMTQRLIAEGRDLAIETTLVGNRVLALMDLLRKEGYCVYLVYLWLPDVELSVARVVQRGLRGRHYIPLATLERRYRRSMGNFLEASRRADFWVAVDNSRILPKISGWGGRLMGRALSTREPESLAAFLTALDAVAGDCPQESRPSEILGSMDVDGDHGDTITPAVLERMRLAVVEEIKRQPQECVCTWIGGRLVFEEWRSAIAGVH